MFTQENAFENVVWKMAAIFLGLNVLLNNQSQMFPARKHSKLHLLYNGKFTF